MLSRKYLSDLFYSIAGAQNVDALWAIMEEFCRHHNLVHGRVSIYDLDDTCSPETLLHVRTYPEGPDTWGNYYIEQKLYDHDRSFHLVFQHKTETLLWSDMDRLTRRGSEANRVFEDMRKFGIGEGLLAAKSSNILDQTILLGIAGAARIFQGFQTMNYEALQACLRYWNGQYLKFAIRDGILKKEEPSFVKLADREREVIRLISLDKQITEIATELNMKERGVYSAIDRARLKTGLKLRGALVGYAIRTGQIK